MNKIIEKIRLPGAEVREITPYQYRINECLDIFPKSQKYHDIRRNVRGRYDELNPFLEYFFGLDQPDPAGQRSVEKREPSIIVDIDGTLANLTHRLPYIKKRPKDWDSFFDRIEFDTAIWQNINLVRTLAANYRIIIVSGRPLRYSQKTVAWLHKQGVPFNEIHFRPNGDRRPDDEVKQEILTENIDIPDVKLVIDDRPRVVAMWRKMGLDVLDVGSGIDF